MSGAIDAVGAPAAPRSRLAHWACFSILFILILALYAESWQAMRRVWDSPTYAHGYVVPLITVWLIWGRREELGSIVPAIGWSALAGMAILGLVWLAGDLAGVNAATHFAAVGLVVLSVPLAFGWPTARALCFPLAFLFFAVPFGDFLVPWLMEATATATIALIQLSGVPVYREGLSFTLPSGTWEIIEECSGQRYLVAATPLACLYAWFSFRQNRTRWLFVGFAVVVAVVANWIRAWGIVMLGHFSDMTLAVGIDHLIYGWGFFGVVVGLLFWLGSRWTEAAHMKGTGGERAPPARSGSIAIGNRLDRIATVNSTSLALLAGALVAACWPVLSNHLSTRKPVPLDLVALAAQLPGLVRFPASDGSLDGDRFTPAYRGAREQVSLDRLDESGRPVAAWIGSFEDQRNGGEMIQHANSIRSRADKRWALIAERIPFTVAAGTNPQVVEYVLADAADRVLVWRSFFIDGRPTASEATAKLLTAWRIARGRGDRSLAVFLWTPLDDGEQQARARLARTMAPLASIVSEARGQP